MLLFFFLFLFLFFSSQKINIAFLLKHKRKKLIVLDYIQITFAIISAVVSFFNLIKKKLLVVVSFFYGCFVFVVVFFVFVIQCWLFFLLQN